jgi:predicted RNA-binding protein with PIN domain
MGKNINGLISHYIEHAKMATRVWNALENKEFIGKYFHLRPTGSGVTIVSTLPFAPMRGVDIKTELQLKDKLDKIVADIPKISSVNINTALECLKKNGFKNRERENVLKEKLMRILNENLTIFLDDKKTASACIEKLGIKTPLEEHIQAIFINTMGSNNNLQRVLKSNGPIKFVASELIFESGKNKIDVVGFDGKSLYFFELKKGRTTIVDQLVKYKKYYEEKRTELNKLLSAYPINAIDSIMDKPIKPVMVMQYAENSINKADWKKSAEANEIEIIFFQDSYIFTSVR